MSDKFVQDLKYDTRLHCSGRWRWITQSHVVCFVVGVLLTILVSSGIVLAISYDDDNARAATANVTPPQPKPNLFIRLEGVEGSTCVTRHLLHQLSISSSMQTGYRRATGTAVEAGNSMLRVSYHGMILAWGHVPWFCVEGRPTENAIDGVVTVEAKADGVELREEVRNLVQSELDVVGKAEFEVEGEVEWIGISSLQDSPG
ncbi:hypothetical protein HU200_004315 [Digitaria exilis]|uniref:Uncharacterized protein n=1 Tax=Digitaria exilis TaxID=1010633 RepID=A0A835FSP6_9POAL|nr:hypothetical protein HU200_004315 [Digitaria exilis]